MEENFYNWEWFIQKFGILSKIDLTAYKRPQMERRINSFMRTQGAGDYKLFLDVLNRDRDVYRRFVEHITINVSEFFRNPSHWKIMEEEIIPSLLKEHKSLNIWSAGCSSGEEPYSLAMLCKEKKYPLAGRILATDLDKEVLEKATIGLYSQKALEGVPSVLIKKYFQEQGKFYRISDELKKMIEFKQQDLLRDSFSQGFDLILCRNVVIYFTEETKQKLYRKFANAMRSKGVLFIGSTEQIFQARDLGLKSVATFFYRKE